MLLGFISISYFFSLLLHLPALVTSILIIVYGFFSYKWTLKNIVTETIQTRSAKHTIFSYIILLAGIIIITNRLYYFEHKYGDWDAWLIWNYHAKYLAHPEYWKQLFTLNKISHPDYPLFIPGNIGFFWRLLGTDSQLIPFALSFFITLIIPVIIFLSLKQKNLLIAGVVLILLGTDDFYLIHAIAQYADAPLALFFLTAIISVNYLKTNKYIAVILGALLGCCIWIKNEGAMLSLLFCLFYIKDILVNGRWKYFLAGIAFPLLAILLFKTMAPVNNLLENRTVPLVDYFTDSSRYKLIASYLVYNLNNNFMVTKYGLIVYVIFCIVNRQFPGKDMWLLLSCVAGCFFVYVLSNQGLEWHLQTSMDRVLLQLMPSFVYVIATKLSTLKIPFLSK